MRYYVIDNGEASFAYDIIYMYVYIFVFQE